MTTEKTYNEKAFDKLFQEQDKKQYDFSSLELGRRDRKIITLLTEYGIKDKSCLDIGPGTGRWLEFLKIHKARKLFAADVSAEALANCSLLCDDTHKVDVEKDRLKFDDESFDIILAFMILEHIRDPENFISEIARVARKGAIILMTIPNILSFLSRIKMLVGKLPIAITGDKTHVKFYREQELRKLFSSHQLHLNMIPTSFSVNPLNTKSLRIPSNRVTKTFDDHLLFKVTK